MFKHFLVVAWRNLKRNKLVLFIQIAGLSLGLATFILGARYVQFEKSYDKYNDNYQRIFRVQSYKKNDINIGSEGVCFPIAQYLKNNYPEVEKSVIIDELKGKWFSSSPELTFYEKEGFAAETDIFAFFKYEFIEGDPNTALEKPYAIVLTESLANKYFPEQKAIGKIIKTDDDDEFEVTAVIKDIPKNSHILPAYFISMGNKYEWAINNWGNGSFLVYVLLKPGVDSEQLNDKIKTVIDNYAENNQNYLFLHPLKNLHLDPNNSGDLLIVMYSVSVIVFLILILSAINFMNLATAYSSARSKEIGIRKVNGGNKNMLVKQYLFESVFYASIALIFALIIAKFSIGVFNKIVEREITLDYLSNPALIIIIIVVALITGFLSGIYPAFIISSFKPVMAIKGLSPFSNKQGKAKGIRTMVLIQFTLSAILISGSFWNFSQVRYLQNKDLGFNKENLLHVSISHKETNMKYSDFKNMILQHAGIEKMCITKNTPLCRAKGTEVTFEGQNEKSKTFVRKNNASSDFIETMGIKLIKGRNFYENPEQNNKTCIINETAIKASGWRDDPIGKWVLADGEKYLVVGILKDFHEYDVHNKISPYILLPSNENMSESNNLVFRISPNSFLSSYEHIKNSISKAYPNHLFRILRYDDAMHKKDVNTWNSISNTSLYFTAIAVLIAVSALLALVVFAVQKRNKEIGIRKVQGAKFTQVYLLLIKEYVFIILIATIIAIPVPEILAGSMPGAYKYHLHFYEYILIFLFSTLIALLAGSYHIIKASNRNPVEAIKYE